MQPKKLLYFSNKSIINLKKSTPLTGPLIAFQPNI